MSFKLNFLRLFRSRYPIQLSLLTGIGIGSYCFYNMYREKINACLNLNKYIQPLQALQPLQPLRPLQPLPWLDAQVQFKRAVDAIDALVVPFEPLHVAQI